jgi:hypothetical protein
MDETRYYFVFDPNEISIYPINADWAIPSDTTFSETKRLLCSRIRVEIQHLVQKLEDIAQLQESDIHE